MPRFGIVSFLAKCRPEMAHALARIGIGEVSQAREKTRYRKYSYKTSIYVYVIL